MIRRYNFGGAANSFVRVLLSDASSVAGGFTDEDWKKTVDWFKGCCAYTGKRLDGADTEKDHAVPMNRTHCGLDLYGNIVPSTSATNRRKGGEHYRKFLKDDPERFEQLERLERFIEESGYRRRAEAFGDLSGYCETQYEVIRGLCKANKGYLQGLAGQISEPPEELSRPKAVRKTLPVEFDPPEPNGAFKKALLSEGWAWITTFYANGTEETSPWNAGNIKPGSNIVANIRSRPQFRPGEWQRRGIARVKIEINRSGT